MIMNISIFSQKKKSSKKSKKSKDKKEETVESTDEFDEENETLNEVIIYIFFSIQLCFCSFAKSVIQL